jgi:hypothetical protein
MKLPLPSSTGRNRPSGGVIGTFLLCSSLSWMTAIDSLAQTEVQFVGTEIGIQANSYPVQNEFDAIFA